MTLNVNFISCPEDDSEEAEAMAAIDRADHSLRVAELLSQDMKRMSESSGLLKSNGKNTSYSVFFRFYTPCMRKSNKIM